MIMPRDYTRATWAEASDKKTRADLVRRVRRLRTVRHACSTGVGMHVTAVHVYHNRRGRSVSG